MSDEGRNSGEREMNQEVSNPWTVGKRCLSYLIFKLLAAMKMFGSSERKMSEEGRNSGEIEVSQEVSNSRETERDQSRSEQHAETHMGGERNNREGEIQKEIEALNEIKKKQEERIQNLESKAFQIANLYFVFQGVIFTSTSTASSLECQDWWFPFTLSSFALVLNCFAFGFAVLKWLKYCEELDQILADIEERKRELASIPSSDRSGVDPSRRGQAQAQAQESSHLSPGPDKWEQIKRQVFVKSAIAMFIGFTVVIMVGCRSILCKSSFDACAKHCQRGTAG